MSIVPCQPPCNFARPKIETFSNSRILPVPTCYAYLTKLFMDRKLIPFNICLHLCERHARDQHIGFELEGCEQLVTYYTSRLPLGPLLFLLLLLFYVYLHKIPHFIKGVLCVFQKHCFFFPILFDQALLAGDKMCMCNQFKGSFHQNQSEAFRLDHTGRRSHMVAREFSWNIETSSIDAHSRQLSLELKTE